VLITSMIGALQFFTQALFIQTPREAGTFLNVYIWQQAFQQQKMGYASALSWILLVLTLLLTLLVFRSQAMWVFYEGEVQQETKRSQRRGLLAGARASQQISESQPTPHGGA
jgi:multiple sugar transport system permease protein